MLVPLDAGVYHLEAAAIVGHLIVAEMRLHTLTGDFLTGTDIY